MDRVLLIQKYIDPKGIHEKTCLMLAYVGASIGFDIIVIHKDKFDASLFNEAEIIIITDFLYLQREQQQKVENALFNKNKVFVRCVMDLSEIEKDMVNHKLYRLSKKNYFCSPQIFRSYLDLNIRGDLSFLAGRIDESWSGLLKVEKQNEQSIKNARCDFWRDIDNILQQERTLKGVSI